MTQPLFEFRQGKIPLLLSLPHSGTEIPADLVCRMTEQGKEKRDTDWFLPDLYELDELADASQIVSRVSRYVVDLNRAPDNESLYPGQRTTGLCRLKTFSDELVYLENREPTDEEVSERVASYWRPYHERLRRELDRLVAEFGFAILLDGHSIAGQLPMLFEGRLPDFNFGTNHGKTCEALFQERVDTFAQSVNDSGDYSAVVNQRFVGGYITRHYGSLKNVNAVQLEMVQETYMDEISLNWNGSNAARVQSVMRAFVRELRQWMESKR